MPDIWLDVDVAIAAAPVNIMPLLDSTDFVTRETAVAYNAAGMDLVWNFVTPAGAFTQTAVTPTTAGNYDWTHQGDGMYTIEIPASGGASINNDTEGFGWFTGLVTGVLPWRGPTIGFRRAALNDLLIEGSTASTNLEDFFDGTGYAGGTAKLTVDAVAISGDTAAADNAEAYFDGTGYAGTNNVIPSVTTVTGSVGSVSAGGITAASIANGAIDRATFAADTGLQTVRSDTAQAGAAGTITLDASASATDDFYNGTIVYLTGGTGVGQARVIYDYVGSTKVASVTPNWATNPDATSTFAVIPLGSVSLEAIQRAVVSTTTAQLGVNAVQWAGAATATDDIALKATLAKGTDITGFNDLSAAQVNTEVDTALVDINLDHLVKSAVDTDFPTTVHLDSVIGQLADNGTTATFDRTTDSLEALRDKETDIETDTQDIQARLPAALTGDGNIKADMLAVSGDATAADNLEKEYDGTGYGQVLVRTTIATLASQTSFTLTAGSADNDAYNGCLIVIEDASTAAQKAVAVIGDYTGSTKTVTLLNDPAVFTMATTDVVTVLSDRSLKATVDNRTLDVTATGGAGVDWGNVENQATAVNLSATNIDPDQVVASVSGAVGSVTGAVGSVTGAVGSVAGNVDGSVGSLATQAKADVNAEVDTALADVNLDHLVGTATGIPAIPSGTFLDQVMDDGTAAFDRTTDSLQAIRDRGDAAWTTASPPSAATIADAVWDEARTDHTSAGSFGQGAASVQGNVTGSVASVTGAVGSVTGAVGSVTAAVTVGTNNDKTGYSLSNPAGIQKNTALANFAFVMVDSTDHVTPKTGLTVTGQRSIDGAAFGSLANSVSEVANGVYKVTLAAADLNGDVITLRFTSTGADDRLITIVTEP